MNREEAVQTDKTQKNYITTNKIRHLFSGLVRELVLNKPEDPIEYLINYLDKNPKRLIVCVQGYDDQERKRLAKNISNKFNFKLIELSELFSHSKDYHTEDDNKINEKVLDALKACESVYKGILISGYPNNIHQVNFIQKSQFLPDRYFLLPYRETELREILSKKFEDYDVDHILKRHEMEKKELLEGLGEFIDFLPTEVDEAIEKLTSTLGMKINKKNIPYDSPRVLMIHPPYLYPSTVSKIIERFSLHHISIQKSLSKLIKKENFKEFVEKHIRKTGHLTKEIELALIETECKSSVSKNKGFVVSGWPLNVSSLSFIKERFLAPHLIFIFDLNEENCIEKFSTLQEGDPEIFPVSPKPTLERFKEEVKNYHELVEKLKESENVQILPWNESEKQVLKTFESLIENPKIYS